MDLQARSSILTALRADAYALESLDKFETLGLFKNMHCFQPWKGPAFSWKAKVTKVSHSNCQKNMLTVAGSACCSFPRNGKLVWTAWLSRGMITEEHVAKYRFGGVELHLHCFFFRTNTMRFFLYTRPLCR